MKANELMLGDWVYVPHNGCASHNGKVKALYESETVSTELEGAGCLCRAESLQPIPLTPEILEKNGFTKSERYEVWRIIRDDYELRVTPWRVAVIFLEDGADKEEYSTPRPKGVHELQHFLKLVKLEKDITL